MPTLITSEGTIEYALNRKRIKNLNLRVRADGSVVASAPMRMPQSQIDAFLRQKAGWVVKTQRKMLAKPVPAPCQHSKEECLALFTQMSDEVFPLFSDVLKGKRPIIKVREMKTRWGSCNLRTHTITLNTRLAEKPRAAMEYVVMHEYVHFIHPDHQAGFHAEMARLMPDYKQRRKLLR